MLDQILRNRYRIVSKINETVTSEIFIATDTTDRENDHHIVIKALKKNALSCTFEQLLRFKNESITLSRLGHPNIISITEIFEFRNYVCIVMEYSAGKSLAEILDADTSTNQLPIGISDTIAIMVQILNALSCAHIAGIVHRDIKPSNILIRDYTVAGKTPVVTLINFGLAVITIDFPSPSMRPHMAESSGRNITDTFHYLPPEQLINGDQAIDARGDLYSLGIIFYLLLTGQLPFDGDARFIYTRHLATIPISPININETIPSIINAIVLKLLEKDPEKRYQSALGVLHDLQKYQGGETHFKPGLHDRFTHFSFKGDLVGRNHEYVMLKNALDTACSGKGNFYLISGEPGIGKTRLIEELKNHSIDNRILYVTGKCPAVENKIPYGLFIELIGNYLHRFKNHPDDRKKIISRKITYTLRENGAVFFGIHSGIREIFSEFHTPVPLEHDREEKRCHMMIARFFLELSAIEEGMVLLLDDLHWCDDASLAVLHELAGNLSVHSLLIVGTARTNEAASSLYRLIRANAEKKIRMTRLDLVPLHREQIAELAAGILFRDIHEQAITELSDLLHTISGGNPLYTIELLKRFVDKQIIFYDPDNRMRINHEILTDHGVPDSMADALAAAISALATNEKLLLSYASAIGKAFDIGLLTAVYQFNSEPNKHTETRNEVRQTVEHMIELRFLKRDLVNSERLEFTHDSIREVCYTLLNGHERRTIHRCIAKTLEARHRADAADEMATTAVIFQLAHHYIEAGDRDGVCQYAYQAGLAAKENYAHEDALMYLSWVLRFTDNDDTGVASRRLAINRMLGELYLTIGKYDDAITLYQNIYPDYQSPTDIKDTTYRYRQICQAYFKKGDHTNCEKFCRSGLQLLGERLPATRAGLFVSIVKEIVIHGLHCIVPQRLLGIFSNAGPPSETFRSIASFYYTLAYSYASKDNSKLLRTILRMLNLAERTIGKSRELAMAQAFYAVLCMAAGRPARAAVYHRKALTLRESLHDDWGIAQSYQWTGYLYLYCANFSAAIVALDTSIEMFRKFGDIKEIGMSLLHTIFVYLHTGDTRAQKEAIDQYWTIAERTGDDFGRCMALLNRGYYCIEIGEYDKAMEDLMTAHNACQEKKMLFEYCLTTIALGKLYFMKENLPTAISYFEYAKNLHETNQFPKEGIAAVYHFLADAYIMACKNTDHGSKTIQREQLKQIRCACRLAIKKTRSNVLEHGQALKVTAKYLALSANNRKAAIIFRKAIAQHRNYNLKIDYADCLYEYGLFLFQTDGREPGLAYLEESFVLFNDMGLIPYRDRIKNLLTNDEEKTGIPFRQLFNRIRDDARITTIIQLTKILNTDLKLPDLLDRVITMTAELTGAGRGIIAIKNGTGGLQFIAGTPAVHPIQHECSMTIINRVMETGESLMTGNAALEYQNCDSIIRYSLKSVLCVPIQYKKTTVGVCYLDNTFAIGLFNVNDMEIVEVLMGLISLPVGTSLQHHDVSQLSEIEPGERFCNIFGITKREREIISLIIKGYSNREISVSLNISINTVNRHKMNIYTKTGVTKKLELISLVAKFFDHV